MYICNIHHTLLLQKQKNIFTEKSHSMQLILLSGGSGKALWPLGNDARSKQFLPLFASPKGGMESMIQRIVRQAREVQLTENITVVTNMQQRDSIINQLGENVNIVIEPERRGTFPATALGATYLEQNKHCQANKTVVVMPCDVYTEPGYFHVISSMVQAVEEGMADLVLMGVRPRKASNKFGYIVPQAPVTNLTQTNEAVKVSHFIEKPNTAQAEALIAQGALWNGGVFAFRLGYITQLVNKRYNAEGTFESLVKNYATLPKTSFDLEVAEQAASAAVVPFTGQWKDLGTWNALCDKLPSTHIGNVLMGNNNTNTHAVNELGIPVFCDGLKDVVVAASPNGIMVCGKEQTEVVKDVANKLITRPMYEERRWGTYRVLDNVTYDNGTQALTKSITLNAGKNISYQVHHHRTEVWTITHGEGIFVLDGEQRRVKSGDVLHIPVGHFHAIKGITELTFIEVQMGSPLIEEDIERFEWHFL